MAAGRAPVAARGPGPQRCPGARPARWPALPFGLGRRRRGARADPARMGAGPTGGAAAGHACRSGPVRRALVVGVGAPRRQGGGSVSAYILAMFVTASLFVGMAAGLIALGWLQFRLAAHVRPQ